MQKQVVHNLQKNVKKEKKYSFQGIMCRKNTKTVNLKKNLQTLLAFTYKKKHLKLIIY